MIRRTALRLVAIVAVAAQLTALPAGIACAASHARPQPNGHCDMPQTSDMAALSAGHAAEAAAPCVALGCATQAPATPAVAAALVVSHHPVAVVGFVPDPFRSFSAPPPSPPPQV